MAILQETQDLLDEMATPTIHQPTDLTTWMTTSAMQVKLYGQQIALLRGLIQVAEDVEPDEVVSGKFEALVQKFDAQARILGIIASNFRLLRGTIQDLKVQEAELKALAQL